MKSNKILTIILFFNFAFAGCKSNSNNVKKHENKKPNTISQKDKEVVEKSFVVMTMMLEKLLREIRNYNRDIDWKKLYGSWICSESVIKDGHEMKNLTFTFNIDGSFNGSMEFDGRIHNKNGRFEINRNALKIIPQDGEVKVVEIEFTNDKMIFWDGISSITFSRFLERQ